MERVITAIRVQQKNHQRVNIDLDGEFAFGLSRIIAAWLKVGDSLSEEKVMKLRDQDTNEVAYQAALRLLNRRLKTELELKTTLLTKGYSLDQIDLVIQRLKSERLLNDELFTKSWIESRNHFHPRSQRLLKFELKKKGIAEELIDNALVDSPAESDLAFQAASSYARRITSQDQKEFKTRLCAYLARRGFSYSSSLPAVDAVWNERIRAERKSGENEGN